MDSVVFEGTDNNFYKILKTGGCILGKGSSNVTALTDFFHLFQEKKTFKFQEWTENAC